MKHSLVACLLLSILVFSTVISCKVAGGAGRVKASVNERSIVANETVKSNSLDDDMHVDERMFKGSLSTNPVGDQYGFALNDTGASFTISDISKKFCYNKDVVMIGCTDAAAMRFTELTAGKYSVLKMSDGNCIDVYLGEVKSKSGVSPYACNSGDTQQFLKTPNADGSFSFKYAKDESKCLDLTYNLARISSRTIIFPCDEGSASQKFRFNP